MFEYISPVLMLFLLSAMTINVQAGSVHKWVDAQGVTHYSDQLPKSLASTNYDAVKQIDVLDSYSNSSRYSENQDDYYSISNQWARMKEERLERKQLQLEKAKLKERQKAVAPQIVYVNQAKDDRSRNIYYPAYQNKGVMAQAFDDPILIFLVDIRVLVHQDLIAHGPIGRDLWVQV